MKKLLMILFLGSIACSAMSQTDTTMQVFVDSVCKCLSKVDLNKIKTQNDAQVALTSCVMNENMSLLMKLAEKRGIDITDQAGMEKIGQELAIEMMKQNCNAFVQMSIKLTKGGETTEAVSNVSTTSGTLASIETKDFCKFILTDASGKRSTFYWMHHFKNSEKFIDQPTKFIGKKMKVSWQETEVYIPAAKGYFKIKEIKGIDLL